MGFDKGGMGGSVVMVECDSGSLIVGWCLVRWWYHKWGYIQSPKRLEWVDVSRYRSGGFKAGIHGVQYIWCWVWFCGCGVVGWVSYSRIII